MSPLHSSASVARRAAASFSAACRVLILQLAAVEAHGSMVDCRTPLSSE
jgi:hypothetical protein